MNFIKVYNILPSATQHTELKGLNDYFNSSLNKLLSHFLWKVSPFLFNLDFDDRGAEEVGGTVEGGRSRGF